MRLQAFEDSVPCWHCTRLSVHITPRITCSQSVSSQSKIPSQNTPHNLHLQQLCSCTEILTRLPLTMIYSAVSSMAALALVIPTVLGDFSIYAASIGGNGISGNSNGWQVYPKTSGAIGCDNALGWVWRKSNDVSGGKYGVRCKGSKSSCYRSTSGEGIKELELNARQTGKDKDPHFSESPSRPNLE